MANEQGQRSEPLLAALRAATSSQHAGLEELLQLDRPLDRPRYVRVLQGFEAFLRQWEPHLRQRLPPALVPRFDGHCRLHLARRDLAALGTAPSPEISPGVAARLPLRGLPETLGSWYVLAGSALGGQVIARQLATTLGLGPDTGAAYFHGWGPDTGNRWREFRELLAGQLQGTPAELAAASGSARETFDLLTDTFRQALHEHHATV